MSRNGSPHRRNYDQEPQAHPGEVMARLMINKNLTIDELAEQAGVPASYIEAVLARRAVMNLSSSQKLGPLLGVGKTRLYKVQTAFTEAGGR